MTTIIVNERNIELLDDGYMKNREEWNEEIAKILAEKEGIQLDNLHWDLIQFLREYYQQFQISPNIKILIKHLSEIRGESVDTHLLYQLFPKGPAFQGCKIAGLPKPTNCIDG